LTLDNIISRAVAWPTVTNSACAPHGLDLHWVDPFGGETEQVGEDKIVAPAGYRGGALARRGRRWRRAPRS
jgi:hypothetical protein